MNENQMAAWIWLFSRRQRGPERCDGSPGYCHQQLENTKSRGQTVSALCVFGQCPMAHVL